jgi:hypothetical protein
LSVPAYAFSRRGGITTLSDNPRALFDTTTTVVWA